MLTIYKASAGSGKTYQLVASYLGLLLKDPRNYRAILAVTFTNKATNEMKSRILGQLHLLASDEASDYLELLHKDTGLTKELIRIRARQILKNILHDYRRFSISTIDSFTQRIIKAFNREMGISPWFTIELDDDRVLEEATDQLLVRSGTDKQLLRWLVDYSREKIENQRSQKIEKDIQLLGKELFKEKFQLFFPEHENTVYTRENIGSFRKELSGIIGNFETTLRKMGQEGVRLMEAEGLRGEDFSGKRNGIGGFFEKLASGEKANFTPTIEACVEDTERWYANTSPNKDQIMALAETRLQPLLKKIIDFRMANRIRYNSALEVRKQLRMLGILTDLKDEVRILLREKGVLQLSDSNLLLSKIIGDSDSPFIYEKAGNHFRHFMLDEFQDTSSLQWNNFKPLVANSLSEGYSNLLVGDVKQSIYRWRNSDWKILAGQVYTDFPNTEPVEKTLDRNWRSRNNIIDFNNAIFGALKDAFADLMPEEMENPALKGPFDAVYDQFRQEPGKPEKEKTGQVVIRFLEKDDFEERSARELVEQVKTLQDKGLHASEIAILVRRNREGAKIIEAFQAASKLVENQEYNLSVLSNESLFLHASRGVNFIIFIIEWLVDPENRITQVALLNLWFSWLKPELAGRTTSPDRDEGEADDFPERQETENRESGEGKGGSPSGTPPASFPWLFTTDTPALFKEELGHKLDQLRKSVGLCSPDEAIMEIASLFGIFQIQTEWPFIQTLIDQTVEARATLSNDLSNLLHWWREEGIKVSVNVNEEVDAVRLLTVHKAKGLEYEAVLIPGFNWDISWAGNQVPVLWCTPNEAPFDKFPLLPVKANQTLKETIFSDDFYEEKINSFIDTFNLVYVAFTRAKSVLMVNAPDPDDQTPSSRRSNPGKKVNNLLKQALGKLEETRLQGSWDSEQNIFHHGIIPLFGPGKTGPGSERINRYLFNPFGDRIRLRKNSEDFLLTGESHQSVRNKGKMVHEILSRIETTADLADACIQPVNEGKIDPEEAQSIRESLGRILNKPEIKSWFDGTYTVITERDLLMPDGILRPDRIMISGNRAIVVDYKWGEKMPEKYHRQVRRYVQTLRETGFEKVEGYIWYLNLDELEAVR